jgi:zinc/manganese transport system permease protein
VFSGFMVNAWTVGSIVAVVAGLVGFFTVLRGSSFVAHAVPNGSLAGAAGASLIGVSTLLGFGVFAGLAALGIGLLGRRGRNDVATALTLVVMLGLGALFISLSSEYAPEIYSLLFGEILGVSASQLVPTAGLAVACVIAVAVLYRPLMLASLLPDVAAARGVSTIGMQLAFLLLVALATTVTVPVVGTLLVFALMVSAPAAARSFTDHPLHAMALSVALALAIIWGAIALSYATDYPVGFFVGTLGAAAYTLGRAWAGWRRRAGAPRQSVRTAARAANTPGLDLSL